MSDLDELAEIAELTRHPRPAASAKQIAVRNRNSARFNDQRRERSKLAARHKVRITLPRVKWMEQPE